MFNIFNEFIKSSNSLETFYSSHAFHIFFISYVFRYSLFSKILQNINYKCFEGYFSKIISNGENNENNAILICLHVYLKILSYDRFNGATLLNGRTSPLYLKTHLIIKSMAIQYFLPEK